MMDNPLEQDNQLAEAPRYWGLVLSRRDSKRLSQKSLQMVGDVPMIVHAWNAAHHSPSIERTFCFTDDSEVLALLKCYGGNVEAPPFARPAQVSDDHSTTDETIQYFLQQAQAHGLTLPTHLVILQPTSPLRRSCHVQGAIERFENQGQGWDGLMSVTRPPKPMAWTFKKAPDGTITYAFDEEMVTNTHFVFPNGAVYIASVERMLAGETLLSGTLGSYEMDTDVSSDVDTEVDLWFANHLWDGTEHPEPQAMAMSRLSHDAPASVVPFTVEVGSPHSRYGIQ